MNSLFATTPLVLPADSLWSNPQDALGPNRPIRPIVPIPDRDLDNYIGQFEQINHFLTTMQEADPENNDFGGIHEGEGDQLWRIVETDNTQEAIRVWCEYGLYFEDTETYRDNIDAAWVYTDNFPAWEESEPGLMYGLHNSGWGLIAEMRYRQAYDDSRRDYGINCADHLVEHTPEITVNMEDRLMPLVAGWAAGTLYLYGLFEENQEYTEAALEIGSQVKAWIDEDPDRLNRNEIWALCGGTAMWGVLNSLGKADSTETADWAIERLESMDVIAGNGQWNSSWNIWYAHAWVAAHDLTGENEYIGNAEVTVDSLLALDTDNDGGIPATIGDADNRDQAWVSAYTAWMGLTNLFEILPDVDIAMGELLAPALDRSWPVEKNFTFDFTLENRGSNNNVDCPILYTGDIEYNMDIEIEGWQSQSFGIERVNAWQAEEPGEYQINIIANHEQDADRSNDTLSFDLSILPTGSIRIITRSIDGDPVASQLYLYNIDIDPERKYSDFITITVGDTLIMATAMAGNYRFLVVPEFPYARQWINDVVIEGNDVFEYDMRFIQPNVLLVNQDTDSSRSHYYIDVLESEGYSYHHLNPADNMVQAGFSDGFSTILYYTGDRDSVTISELYRDEITVHQQNGGSLFITGQYIADELMDDEFLSSVLHSQHLNDDAEMQMIDGIAGDAVFDGYSMLILGNQGANNQDDPSGIRPANGGISAAQYRNRGDTSAVVRWEDENGARGVFFAFGFEGISGQVGNTRSEVMHSVLDWLGTPLSIGESITSPLPYRIGIKSVYPNPFNNSVTILSNVFRSDGHYYTIFDMTGRLVIELPMSNSGISYWNGADFRQVSVPNGNYFIVLQRQGDSKIYDSVKVSLIK